MIASIVFSAAAAELGTFEVTSITPRRSTEYNGIDADTLDWLCPAMENRAIAASGAELQPGADCTLIRDVTRGRIAAERTDPLVAELNSELDEEAEYAWAEQAAVAELTALGLDPDQVGGVTARFVNRVSSADPHTKYSVGLVVFVDRSIEGVPVVGNDAAVIFDLDHTLRAVYSTWPSIGVAQSSWSLPETGDCSPTGASSWAAREVEPDTTREVTLSTALLHNTASTSVRMVVLSEAMVPGVGGSYKRQIRVCDGGEE